jgi:hypothetical protein
MSDHIYHFSTYRTDEDPIPVRSFLIEEFIVYRARAIPTVENFEGASGFFEATRADNDEGHTFADQWIWYGSGKSVAFDTHYESKDYLALSEFIFAKLEELGIKEKGFA